MATLRATFTAWVDDGPLGDTFPVILEWSSSTAIGHVFTTTVTFAADVTLAVPVGTHLIILEPPANNVLNWRIKGLAGDTGVTPSTIGPTILKYAAGQPVLLRAATADILLFKIRYL